MDCVLARSAATPEPRAVDPLPVSARPGARARRQEHSLCSRFTCVHGGWRFRARNAPTLLLVLPVLFAAWIWMPACIAEPGEIFSPGTGVHGMAASQEANATRVAVDILRAGGNAIDAAVALGFTLTFFTVQAVPAIASAFGWPPTLALMALGPAAGIVAIQHLMRATQSRLHTLG